MYSFRTPTSLYHIASSPIVTAFVALMMLYSATIIVEAQCPCPYMGSIDTVTNVPIVIQEKTYFISVEYCSAVFTNPQTVNPCDSDRLVTSMSSVRKVFLPAGKLGAVPDDSILQAVLCLASPQSGNIFHMATFNKAPAWRWTIGLPVCTQRDADNTISACADSPCVFVRQDYEYHPESKQVIPSAKLHNCRFGVETCTSECSPAHFRYSLAGC